MRKGDKAAVIPLAPRTPRALDLCIGERRRGPSSWAPRDGGWTATPPTRTVKRLAPRVGITRRISPHIITRRLRVSDAQLRGRE